MFIAEHGPITGTYKDVPVPAWVKTDAGQFADFDGIAQSQDEAIGL